VHDVLSGSVSSSLKKPKKEKREKENNDNNNNNNNHFALLLLLGGSKIIDATCTEKGPCVQVPLVYLLQIRCSDPLSLSLSLSLSLCNARAVAHEDELCCAATKTRQFDTLFEGGVFSFFFFSP
jgi:hypothetical protein